MMKLLLSMTALAMVILTGCAARPAADSGTSTDASSVPSRSGVEFYGTLDAGIGSQRISR